MDSDPYAFTEAEARFHARSRLASGPYGGIGRATFLVLLVVTQLIALSIAADPVMVMAAFLIVTLALLSLRLKNAASNRWFSLLIVIPVASFWLLWACLVRQGGYSDVGKLDWTGSVVHNLLIVATVVLLLITLGLDIMRML